MFVHRYSLRINWGDCDPAGIVFHPNYFAIFDAATEELFEAAGFPKKQLTESTAFKGYPVVEARAKFILPSAYGETVAVEATIAEFRRSSFDLVHRIYKGEALAVEGFQTRVWAQGDPANPGRLKSAPIPQNIIDKFTNG